MKNYSSVKFNYFMNVILTLSGFIFPIITFPYVSRVLSPVGIGKYSFASSVASYFITFSQLGIPVYGIRICSQVRDNKQKLSQTVFELYCIHFATSFLSYIIFIFAISGIPRLSADKELMLIYSIGIFFTMLGADWVYRALEKFSYITIRSIVFKFISVIAMFLLVRDSSDYIVYAVISVFAGVGSNLLNFINLKKYIKFKKLQKPSIIKHIKPILVFFSMSIATTIYTNLDSVMLGFMSNDVEVGYYSAAIKMKTILVSIVTSLGTVLLPRISYYIKKKEMERFKILIQSAIEYILIVGLSFSIYFLIFAEYAILFLSGNDFLSAVDVMRIITPTILLIGLSNLTGIQILVPLGRENAVLISEISGAIVDVLVNYMLIPQYGAAGAAVGTTIAEAVVLAVQIYCVRDVFFQVFKEVKVGRILIPLIIASILTLFLNKVKWSILFVQILWTSVLFFSIYGIGLLFAKEPLSIEILRKIKVIFMERLM